MIIYYGRVGWGWRMYGIGYKTLWFFGFSMNASLRGNKMIDLQMEFDKYEDDFGEFGLVKNKLNARSDLCAFLLLDKLVPENQDMVSATGHDVIYLDTDCNKLAEVATYEDILTLTRCGVMYSVEYDCLEMGV